MQILEKIKKNRESQEKSKSVANINRIQGWQPKNKKAKPPTLRAFRQKWAKKHKNPAKTGVISDFYWVP